jgi:hypothetical protein
MASPAGYEPPGKVRGELPSGESLPPFFDTVIPYLSFLASLPPCLFASLLPCLVSRTCLLSTLNRRLLLSLPRKMLKYLVGGDTVSTEAVATRRHAGRHLPAIGWKTRTANQPLALAA